MKKLEELPAVLQQDLILLKDYILSEVPSTALIYLYGPCSQEPFEGPDYDLLIVTSKTNAYQAKLNVERSKGRYYCSANSKHKHLNFITVPISRFFQQLGEGNYFFKEVLTTGVELHNAKPYTIILPKRISLAGWKNSAQIYYNVCWDLSGNFLWHARLDFLFKQYTPCAFRLHQACEQLYRALHLVHTLEIPREHDMEELISMTRKYDPELPKLFDKNKRESRLLETFKNAYTHSRYDPTFQVSYKDIRSIWPKVKRLRKITRKTCLKKIDALDELSTGRIKEQPQPEKTSLCGRLHTYLIDMPQNWIASINNPERRRI